MACLHCPIEVAFALPTQGIAVSRGRPGRETTETNAASECGPVKETPIPQNGQLYDSFATATVLVRVPRSWLPVVLCYGLFYF